MRLINGSFILINKNKSTSARKTIRCSLILLITCLAAGASSAVHAENVFMRDGSIRRDVQIISQTPGSITIRPRNESVKTISRSDILRINKIGLKPVKVYVLKRNGGDFSAYLVDKNETAYTFRKDLDKAGEFSIKKSDILCIAEKTIREMKAEHAGRIQFDIPTLISTIDFFMGLLFALLLLKIKRGNRRANMFLALFLINESIIQFEIIYYFSGLVFVFPHLLEIATTFKLLYPPLLYWYVSALTMPSFRFRRIQLFLLLPALVITIYWHRYILFLSGEQKILLHYNYIPQIGDLIVWHLFLVQIVIYTIPIIRLLSKHRRRIKENFSSTEKISLSWLRFLVVSLPVFEIVLLAIYIYDAVNNLGLTRSAMIKTVWPALHIIYAFLFGYKGLMQQKIFSEALGAADEDKGVSDEKISIPTEKVREIMDKLTAIMEHKKPYLDPGLTLPMLADMITVPRNYLSLAINADRNQNFYDFVNSYRVETAKQYLNDPDKQHMNILQIAYAAGFNTKATFNTFFKKNTNCTPREYKKVVLIDAKPELSQPRDYQTIN